MVNFIKKRQPNNHLRPDGMISRYWRASAGCVASMNDEERVNMTRAEGMLDAFQRVGWGALLIDADGRVISLNDEARRHVGARSRSPKVGLRQRTELRMRN